MRFREVYDNPERRIENLPYENQEDLEVTDEALEKFILWDSDNIPQNKYKEIENGLKYYLQALSEPEGWTTPLLENSKIAQRMEMFEQEISAHSKDKKWQPLVELMEQVKAGFEQLRRTQQRSKDDEVKSEQKSFKESLKVDVPKQPLEESRNAFEEPVPMKTVPNLETTEGQPTVPKDLPSWDLGNWGMTKEQVNQTPRSMPQKDIKQALDEKYGDVFTTENVLKIQDKEMKQKVLQQNGVSPFAKVDVFLVEQGDKEEGDSLYILYMMDKNGKIRQMNMPIKEDGDKDILVNPASSFITDKDGNKQMAYFGEKCKSAVTWELIDGSTLTPYHTKDGKLHLGKSNKGQRDDFVFSVKTEDILNREEQEELE